MSDIASNLLAIMHRIDVAARTTDRRNVQLIAVSKGHGESAVRDALAAGQKIFGENRVQEAKAKFALLRPLYKDLGLHLIGPLQTNKAEDAVALFDVIQTLDRPKLAESLVKAMRRTGRNPICYIEVNIGHEPQKAGIAPEDLVQFLTYCRKDCGLTVAGLMCIPPQIQKAESHFRALKQLADQNALPHISMGMSNDFEVAIACGATEVRVGTAIFGERLKPAINS